MALGRVNRIEPALSVMKPFSNAERAGDCLKHLTPDMLAQSRQLTRPADLRRT
jgi:hypothetical protein